jgi:hypothetical protein
VGPPDTPPTQTAGQICCSLCERGQGRIRRLVTTVLSEQQPAHAQSLHLLHLLHHEKQASGLSGPALEHWPDAISGDRLPAVCTAARLHAASASMPQACLIDLRRLTEASALGALGPAICGAVSLVHGSQPSSQPMD